VGLAELPVFVRGGAIVPHQPLVQSTSQTPKGPLELRVYPGPDCHGSLYLDDGASFDYRKGAFARLALSCEAGPGSVSVTTGPAQGTYAPWFTSLAFVICGAPSRPREITVAGHPSRDFTYDAAAKAVTVTAPYLKGGQTVVVRY
jgi:alpha-glucosidase